MNKRRQITDLQKRILETLALEPYNETHRDRIAVAVSTTSAQVTRALNKLASPQWSLVRNTTPDCWKLTEQGQWLYGLGNKSTESNQKTFDPQVGIPMTDEEFYVLDTLAIVNDSGVVPDKATIFNECLNRRRLDEYEREKYYKLIDELVGRGLIEIHRKNYGSAAWWYKYSVTSEARHLLKEF